MTTEPWTNWCLWNSKAEQWEFNHTERGHAETLKPVPKHPTFTEQRNWKGQTWKKEHVYR